MQRFKSLQPSVDHFFPNMEFGDTSRTIGYESVVFRTRTDEADQHVSADRVQIRKDFGFAGGRVFGQTSRSLVREGDDVAALARLRCTLDDSI